MSFNPRQSRGSVARALVWAVSGILLLAVAALTGFDFLVRSHYQPPIDRMREDVTAHVDLFCEEQAKLADDWFFQEPRSQGDAGPLLNDWLGWEPGREMPEYSPLRVPAHLPQRSKDWEDWLTSDVDLSGLDFTWMGRLIPYDRWDLLKNTPMPPTKPYDFQRAAVPDFIPLQLWAKFRLRHGIQTGKTAEAARDVRHLAWLAYRTDTLLGAMIATALLGLERKAWESMASPPPEWHPMSQAQVDRMRAVLWTSMTFSSIAAPPDVARRARTCGQAISRCTGLAEAIITARFLKPFAEHPYREAYAALAEEVASAPCPTSLVQTLWEHGATAEDSGRGRTELVHVAGKMLKLPRRYVNRHIAGLFLSMGVHDLDRLKQLRTEGTADAKP